MRRARRVAARPGSPRASRSLESGRSAAALPPSTSGGSCLQASAAGLRDRGASRQPDGADGRPADAAWDRSELAPGAGGTEERHALRAVLQPLERERPPAEGGVGGAAAFLAANFGWREGRTRGPTGGGTTAARPGKRCAEHDTTVRPPCESPISRVLETPAGTSAAPRNLGLGGRLSLSPRPVTREPGSVPQEPGSRFSSAS
jgi:hypothetical protein